MVFERFIWRCPDCKKPYRIKVGKRPPATCPNCHDAEAEFHAAVARHEPEPTFVRVDEPATLDQAIEQVDEAADFLASLPRKRSRLPFVLCAIAACFAIGLILANRMRSPQTLVQAAPEPVKPPPKPKTWATIGAAAREKLRTSACKMVREVIEEKLKAPLNAKWSEWSVDAGPMEYGALIELRSHVDSENEVGVFLRTRFNGAVKYSFDGDELRVQYVIANGEVVFADRDLAISVLKLMKARQQQFEATLTPRKWLRIDEFAGTGDIMTGPFTAKKSNWRITLRSAKPAEVSAVDLSDGRSTIVTTETGITKTLLTEGTFKLNIITQGTWSVFIQEPEYSPKNP